MMIESRFCLSTARVVHININKSPINGNGSKPPGKDVQKEQKKKRLQIKGNNL